MKFHLTLCSLIFIAACAPAVVEEASTTEADLQAINDLGQGFSDAYNAGDTAALTGLFATDGMLLPPDAAILTGQEAIQSLYEGTFARFTGEHSTTFQELEVAGDWAFGRGTYTVKLTPKEGGEVIENEGKYIVICQRQVDGSWKLARLIWNTNSPPPGETS